MYSNKISIVKIYKNKKLKTECYKHLLLCLPEHACFMRKLFLRNFRYTSRTKRAIHLIYILYVVCVCVCSVTHAHR